MIHGIYVAYKGKSIIEFGIDRSQIDNDLLFEILFENHTSDILNLGKAVRDVYGKKFKYSFFQCERVPLLMSFIIDIDDARSEYESIAEKINNKLANFEDLFEDFEGDPGRVQLIFSYILSNIPCNRIEVRRGEFCCSLLEKAIEKKYLTACNLLNLMDCIREKNKFDQIVQLGFSFLPFEQEFPQVENFSTSFLKSESIFPHLWKRFAMDIPQIGLNPPSEELYNFIMEAIEQKIQEERELTEKIIELTLSFLPFEQDLQKMEPRRELKEIFDFVKKSLENHIVG